MKQQPPQLFTLKPLAVTAFQWLPTSEDYTEPKWFTDMYETGQAFIVRNSKEEYIKLSNKRGEYKGLPGDWVCKDSFGHIFVTSQKTFHQRYDSELKGN